MAVSDGEDVKRCIANDCSKSLRNPAAEFCETHYKRELRRRKAEREGRKYRGPDLAAPIQERVKPEERGCKHVIPRGPRAGEKCDQPHHAHGYCKDHYNALDRGGARKPADYVFQPAKGRYVRRPSKGGKQ